MRPYLEGELKAALLLAAPTTIPDLRLFNRSISVVRVEGRRIKHGIKGRCDLYGYWRGGQGLELELKALGGSVREGQKEWAEFCRQWGITHLTLKPIKGETLKTTVDRWLSEVLASRRAF